MQELKELQRKKALQILEYKKQQERMQRRAFCELVINKTITQETGIPYKIIKDLREKERIGEFTEIMPNRFYPAPGMSLEARYANEGLMGLEFGTPLWREKSEEAEHLEEMCYKWDLKTSQGIKKWEYYMARFLMGYDFDTFINVDWTGQKIPECEAEDIKKYYKSIQQNCRDRPEEFYLEENLRLQEHLRVYDCPYDYIK